MATFTLDIDEFSEALTTALTFDMGKVSLIPGAKATAEVDPTSLPTTPTVMGSAELVPSVRYRFPYYRVRYLLIGYFLERDGEYEVGDLEILSEAPNVDPNDGSTFTPPTIHVRRRPSILTNGSGIGVEFGVAYDPDVGVEAPVFGITYQIRVATPSVFPTLRMFRKSTLAMEQIDTETEN